MLSPCIVIAIAARVQNSEDRTGARLLYLKQKLSHASLQSYGDLGDGGAAAGAGVRVTFTSKLIFLTPAATLTRLKA